MNLAQLRADKIFSPTIKLAEPLTWKPAPPSLDLKNFKTHSGLDGLWITGSFLARAAHDLNPAHIGLGLLKKMRYAGGEYKTFTEAIGLWKVIPAQIRAAGPEAVQDFLRDKDWSHIIPKSHGGNATVDNGIWEHFSWNRARGDRVMTPGEYTRALGAMRFEALSVAARMTLSGMGKGALNGFVRDAGLAGMEYGLKYMKGQLTGEELARQVLGSAAKGASSAILPGLTIGLLMLCPPLISVVAPIAPLLNAASTLSLVWQFAPLGLAWYDHVTGQSVQSDFLRTRESIDKALSRSRDEVIGGLQSSSESVGKWAKEGVTCKPVNQLFPARRESRRYFGTGKSAIDFGSSSRRYGGGGVKKLSRTILDIRSPLGRVAAPSLRMVDKIKGGARRQPQWGIGWISIDNWPKILAVG